MNALRPGAVVDRYEVEALAGEGGVGAVYRVRHRTLGTIHALKVLGFATGPSRARFEREARIQARLIHPNVVRVTDLVEVDDRPALVAEYVDGADLARMLEEADGRLPLELALSLFSQVVAGVQAAHAVGVVHRDLKPHNVLVSTEDGRLRARVCDFGIARLVDGEAGGPTLTRTGGTMGTPAYMAPEQHEDAAHVDGRADIFSLGCMLYELCLGRRPFREDSVLRLARAARDEDYPAPETVDPTLPEGLRALIVACLRGDPAERLSTCQELAARLDALGLVPAPPALPEPDPTPSPPLLKARAAPTAGWTVVPPDASELEDRPRPTRVWRPLLVGVGVLVGVVALLRPSSGDPSSPAPEAQAPVALAPLAHGQEAAGPLALVPAVALPPAPVSVEEAPIAAEPPRSSEAKRATSASSTAPPGPVSPTTTVGETAEASTRLILVTDGVKVRLVGGGGSFTPGAVPPGRYLVRATFDGQEELDAGYVSVRPGEDTKLSCDPRFAQCRRLE